MKKSDLKIGDVLQTRNGYKYFLVLNSEWGCCKDIMLNLNGGFMPLEDYNENLLCKDDNEFDIVKVCSNGIVPNFEGHVLNKKTGFEEWTWEREEDKKEKSP